MWCAYMYFTVKCFCFFFAFYVYLCEKLNESFFFHLYFSLYIFISYAMSLLSSLDFLSKNTHLKGNVCPLRLSDQKNNHDLQRSLDKAAGMLVGKRGERVGKREYIHLLCSYLFYVLFDKLEEAATEAVIRRCPKCGHQWMKEGNACNNIRCSRLCISYASLQLSSFFSFVVAGVLVDIFSATVVEKVWRCRKIRVFTLI
jgi:hypothetical protein